MEVAPQKKNPHHSLFMGQRMKEGVGGARKGRANHKREAFFVEDPHIILLESLVQEGPGYRYLPLDVRLTTGEHDKLGGLQPNTNPKTAVDFALCQQKEIDNQHPMPLATAGPTDITAHHHYTTAA